MASGRAPVVARVRQRLALRWNSQILYNAVGTHVPSHRLRQRWLRVLGASIGRDVAIFRGTTILDPANLTIGDNCAIGWRCVLDARGGITIGRNVNISSDVQLITADHDPDARDFRARLAPIVIESRSWLATGVIVLKGVTVHEGAIAAAGATVVGDVDAFTIVGGVPARVIGKRTQDLDYEINFRPRFF